MSLQNALDNAKTKLEGSTQEATKLEVKTEEKTKEAILPGLVVDNMAGLDVHIASDKAIERMTNLPTIEPYQPEVGDYLAIRLNSLVKANGARIIPNIHGYYSGFDAETKELLEYYAGKGLVEIVVKG